MRIMRIMTLTRLIISDTIVRAEAEAVKAEIEFAKMEGDLKIQQAQLEASIETLRLEKRGAATQATAEVLEMAVELESGENMTIAELPIEDTAEHT